VLPLKVGDRGGVPTGPEEGRKGVQTVMGRHGIMVEKAFSPGTQKGKTRSQTKDGGKLVKKFSEKARTLQNC